MAQTRRRALPPVGELTGQNVGMDGERPHGQMYRVFEALDELVTTVEEARGVPMTYPAGMCSNCSMTSAMRFPASSTMLKTF